jgi:hypothetical protein
MTSIAANIGVRPVDAVGGGIPHRIIVNSRSPPAARTTGVRKALVAHEVPIRSRRLPSCAVMGGSNGPSAWVSQSNDDR